VIALEYRKKGYKMKVIERIAICEICDNATPQVWIEEAGEFGCQNCYEAYGVEMMEF
jgi:protein-arginine kinase activator protein McsA